MFEVNERFEEMTGYTRKRILGSTLIEIGLLVNPSDRDQYLAALRNRAVSATASFRFAARMVRSERG